MLKMFSSVRNTSSRTLAPCMDNFILDNLLQSSVQLGVRSSPTSVRS